MATVWFSILMLLIGLIGGIVIDRMVLNKKM
jgi:uncharacterized protein YneF (UPF0154 family)